MDSNSITLLIPQIGGLIMVAGGIWLIFKQKIYLNAEKNEVVGVEMPFFGKMRTNVPALGLFIIGIIPLLYPLHRTTTRYLRVEQPLSSDDHPVDVYVVVHTESLRLDGNLVVQVPVISSPDYNPELIYSAGTVTDHQWLDLNDEKHGKIVLGAKQIQNKRGGAIIISPNVAPRPQGF
jgi:hypothetical protein